MKLKFRFGDTTLTEKLRAGLNSKPIARATQGKCLSLGCRFYLAPPYSFDLTLTDSRIFSSLQNFLNDKVLSSSLYFWRFIDKNRDPPIQCGLGITFYKRPETIGAINVRNVPDFGTRFYEFGVTYYVSISNEIFSGYVHKIQLLAILHGVNYAFQQIVWSIC